MGITTPAEVQGYRLHTRYLGLMPFGHKCRANHSDGYSVAFLTAWISPLTTTWLAAKMKSIVGDVSGDIRGKSHANAHKQARKQAGTKVAGDLNQMADYFGGRRHVLTPL